MESRSLAREVALLILGQISEDQIKNIESFSLEETLSFGLDTLLSHLRNQLDDCAEQIKLAQDQLLTLELNEINKLDTKVAKNHLLVCLTKSENVLNVLSDSLEISRLIALSDQDTVRNEAMNRVNFVIQKYHFINTSLDNVMEGWRLKRLPRIDQDILRLAFVDLHDLRTPIPVTCNEAVNLANRYSDEQGRKMINGVLRRLQDSSSFKEL